MQTQYANMMVPKPSPKRAAELNSIAEQVARQYRSDSLSPNMVSGIMRIAEFGLLTLTGFLLYAWYVGRSEYMRMEYPSAILFGAALMVVILELAHSYQQSALRRPWSQIGRLVFSWAGVFAVLSLIGFFLKVSESFSRVWFASWFVTGFFSLMILRFALAKFIRKWARNGRMERRALIVGGRATR